jgi:hypothetical protein
MSEGESTALNPPGPSRSASLPQDADGLTKSTDQALTAFKVARVFFLLLVITFAFGLVSTLTLTTLWCWETRSDHLPGIYHAAGVWGSSTLTLRADHTFTQEVQFMDYDEPSVPPYRQHPAKHEVIAGRWEERGRDLFDQKLLLERLIALGPFHQGEVFDQFECSYGPVQLTGLGIEVDVGADIVYRK